MGSLHTANNSNSFARSTDRNPRHSLHSSALRINISRLAVGFVGQVLSGDFPRDATALNAGLAQTIIARSTGPNTVMGTHPMARVVPRDTLPMCCTPAGKNTADLSAWEMFRRMCAATTVGIKYHSWE